MNWKAVLIVIILSVTGYPQGMDSVWVSKETSPPYSPTLTAQVYVGDTLNFRIGFSTQDTLESFLVGLSYDTTKFELLDMDFDVVNAIDGSPFQWWIIWSPTSITIPCATTILDSICMATWMGLEVAGSMFALQPANWMVGTFSLRAKQSGFTILLPSYLDTSAGFKIPYPCIVDIQVGVNETDLPTNHQKIEVKYLNNRFLYIKATELPLKYLALKLYSPSGRIVATKVFSNLGNNLYIDLNPLLKSSGVYFAVIETPKERHLLRFIYLRK